MPYHHHHILGLYHWLSGQLLNHGGFSSSSDVFGRTSAKSDDSRPAIVFGLRCMGEYTTVYHDDLVLCGEGPSCSALPVAVSKLVVDMAILWLDAYTAAAMKHVVEADEVLTMIPGTRMRRL